MLSNRYITSAVPSELWDRYSAMEMEMILAFARRARDMDYTALWYADKIKAMGILREDLEKIIAQNWPGTQKDLSRTLEQAGFKALTEEEKIYQRAVKAGIIPSAPPIPDSVGLRLTLQAGYSQAVNTLNLTNQTGIRTTIDALDQAYQLAATGFYSLQQSVEMAVRRLADSGITGAVFPSGVRRELAPYVRQVIITAVGDTTRKLSFDRAEEYGSDLIIVSSHAGARPGCAPYQGRVFSRSGKHLKYPPLSSTSYGEPAGLFGINCGHFFEPWFDGIDREPTAEERDPAKTHLEKSNEQVYEEQQWQRYYERKIRKWKHKSEALEAADISGKKVKQAKQKVREWQAKQRAFVDKTGRTRRYDREKVI